MSEFEYNDPIILAISGRSSLNEMHQHSVPQLSLPKNGVSYISVNNQLFIIPPGMAMFIPANTLHGVQKIAGGNKVESVYFVADNSLLPEHPVMLSLSPVAIAVVTRVCQLAMITSASIRVDHLLAVLVDEINDGIKLNYSLPIPEEQRLIQLYEKFCASDAGYPSLIEAAGQINVSPRTLERLFQQELGMSFSLWKQKFIFVRGLELLQRYRRTSIVAYQLGYNSESAFITMFKKLSGGKTPTQILAVKE